MIKTRFGGFLAAFFLTAALAMTSFAQSKTTAAKASLVDINSATDAQLQTKSRT
jgi:DNA uptake protein ComE-like DNA-binding protein